MRTPLRQVVPLVIAQHVEDAITLRAVRPVLLRGPQVSLGALSRADARLNAHLDGLTVGGDVGTRMAQAALEEPGAGPLFVAAVLAIERRELAHIEAALSSSTCVPGALRAIASAFGWVPATQLRGLTTQLLAAADVNHRWLGIAACAMHRVDPGAALAAAINQPDAMLRARALQAAGELGRLDLLPACLAHVADKDPACGFAAMRAAVLLGDRGAAQKSLRAFALQAGPWQHELLALALFSSDASAARAIVIELSARQASLRTLLKAAAWAGDVQVVPWIIKHMADDKHTRLAGEAFSFITGADLSLLGLERATPQHVEGGPTEDPEDDNVAMDEDDSLPWPDPAKVQTWWRANADRMQGAPRCFAGAAPEQLHCMDVLLNHTQRQRIAAAWQLSLARPGTVLFNCAAPGHRQQRLLAAMQGAR